MTEYIGSGDDAALLATLESIEREERAREVKAKRQERQVAEQVTVKIDDFSTLIEKMMVAILMVNDFHRHKRQWRKKRPHSKA